MIPTPQPLRPMPGAMTNLINQADPGFIIFAHFLPTFPGDKTGFLLHQTRQRGRPAEVRVSAAIDFCTFRVEQLTMTNTDVNNPRGSWRTLATYSDKTPAMMLGTAMQAARKAQENLIQRTIKKMQRTAQNMRNVQR